MGGIHHQQRRAIESVIGDVTSKSEEMILWPRTVYLLGEDQLYLLGISNGVGTCSDVHDVDVAVFGTEPEGYRFDRHVRCHSAVLLRKRREGEFDPEPQKELLPICLAVEGLAVDFVTSRNIRVDFKSTGRVKLYVPLVK